MIVAGPMGCAAGSCGRIGGRCDDRTGHRIGRRDRVARREHGRGGGCFPAAVLQVEPQQATDEEGDDQQDRDHEHARLPAVRQAGRVGGSARVMPCGGVGCRAGRTGTDGRTSAVVAVRTGTLPVRVTSPGMAPTINVVAALAVIGPMPAWLVVGF